MCTPIHLYVNNLQSICVDLLFCLPPASSTPSLPPLPPVPALPATPAHSTFIHPAPYTSPASSYRYTFLPAHSADIPPDHCTSPGRRYTFLPAPYTSPASSYRYNCLRWLRLFLGQCIPHLILQLYQPIIFLLRSLDMYFRSEEGN